MTHICVGNLNIIGSDNGMSPGRRQAIIWISAWTLLIVPLGTNFNEISIEIHTFSFKKIHLKLSSAKWQQFCLRLNVLIWKLTTHKLDKCVTWTYINYTVPNNKYARNVSLTSEDIELTTKVDIIFCVLIISNISSIKMAVQQLRIHCFFDVWLLVTANWTSILRSHYSDIIMGAMASQITSLAIVLLNGLCRSKKTSKVRVTGLCEGNSPCTGEFLAQSASNAENVSIWWRHHMWLSCSVLTTHWGLDKEVAI